MAAAICSAKARSYGSHGSSGPARWLKLAVRVGGPGGAGGAPVGFGGAGGAPIGLGGAGGAPIGFCGAGGGGSECTRGGAPIGLGGASGAPIGFGGAGGRPIGLAGAGAGVGAEARAASAEEPPSPLSSTMWVLWLPRLTWHMPVGLGSFIFREVACWPNRTSKRMRAALSNLDLPSVIRTAW